MSVYSLEMNRQKKGRYEVVELTGNYRIGDRIFKIKTCFRDTHVLCESYGTSVVQFDYLIETTTNDIEVERQKSIQESLIEGFQPVQFSDGYLETLAVYRRVANCLLSERCLIFHGSAISVDNSGYIFTAKSGTGKSTHTRLWRELLNDRAVMINDDKPILRISDAGVTVYGTPWMGKHNLGNNVAVPLKGIAFLQRGQENWIEEITAREAWPQLLQQSYRSNDLAATGILLHLVDQLSQKVSLYRMQCNMELEAAKIAYERMCK